MKLLLQERNLVVALVLGVAGYALEHTVLAAGGSYLLASLAAILALIVAASFRVAHHAEALAERLGEPYGTMILTLAAVIVEVVVLGILMIGTHNSTLARDTIYSAVMIDINGIIGLAAIIGGFKHGEQKYNLDASNSYIAMLLVALGLSLFVPDFIKPEHAQRYMIFNIVMMVLLYALFLRIQTVEHRYFFQYGGSVRDNESAHGHRGVWWNVSILIASIVIIGGLSELLSAFLEQASVEMHFPLALTAALVALISASPEILTALRAASRDQMQTVINIALGASMATVLLTVPIILGLGLLLDFPIEMGMTPVQAAMLLLTLLAAMINLHDGESNVLEGAVHFALFLTFIMLTWVI